MAKPPSPELLRLERELAEANHELRLDLAQAALDIAGIADPTPISDLTSGAISLARGDLVGAGLSLISIVPYAGDALAKTSKGAKLAKKIEGLKSKISGLTKRIGDLSTAAKYPIVQMTAKAREAGAQQASRRRALEQCPKAKAAIQDSKGFIPLGLEGARLRGLYNSDIGRRALARTRQGTPRKEGEKLKTYNKRMKKYTMDALKTFSGAPKELHLRPGDKLYKLVPNEAGKGLPGSSPFFATEQQMLAWRASGKSAADFFGLPLYSHADSYVEHVIEAKEATTVLVGKIAPTFQQVPGLAGGVVTSGGGSQAIVSNRSAFKTLDEKRILK